MDKEQSKSTAKGTTNLNSVSEADRNQLVYTEEIADTPFTAVRFDEKYFLAMGKYRLTKPFETMEEVLDEAKNPTWFRIMQIVQIMIEEHEKNKTKGKEENAK